MWYDSIYIYMSLGTKGLKEELKMLSCMHKHNTYIHKFEDDMKFFLSV